MAQKIHTTNYQNVFICVADDCPAKQGEVPPEKVGKRTIANIQYDLVANHPYRYTSDDVLVLSRMNREQADVERFDDFHFEIFSKGQPCLRSSPLTKRYGWGVHFNGNSQIALYGCETAEYLDFLNDLNVKKVKALKSKK